MNNFSDSVRDYDYNLPVRLIAQQPAARRDSCRLLFLAKNSGEIRHGYFSEIIDYFRPGDFLVINDSKVFPARLIGHKAKTGGELEIFLHHQIDNDWEVLIRGRAQEGLIVIFPLGLEAEIIKKIGDGLWQLRFNKAQNKFWNIINKIGQVPLPPYIKRPTGSAVSDKNNYQTVFASQEKIGSAAAPTAGLHFTKKLLNEIKSRGVSIVPVTLHVGLGTFAPVKTEKISEHKIHSELVFLEKKAIRKILAAKNKGQRIIAVGTTSCRVLESLAVRQDEIEKSGICDQTFWTNIFIYPGYKFKLTDALITNFHLPKSTLLMLVSALAGKKNIDLAYQAAIAAEYRFFSYGDAMFIY